MVALKQTNKKKLTSKGAYFMLHYVRYFVSWNMIALSSANLVYSLLCWLKDCNNGQKSENEETLLSEREMIYYKVTETL